MDITKVIHTFRIYSGLSETESLEYEQLFLISMTEANSMLREDVVLEDDTNMCYLAGVFAFYKYAVIKSAAGADEIKLGDVTVKNGGGKLLEAAMVARTDAIALCSEILADSFYFSKTAC